MMFLCIACLFLGPAFNMAAGIASWQSIAELKNQPGKIGGFQMNVLGQRLLLSGFVISILYPLFFVLFLRAISICLRSRVHLLLINVFLVFAGVLAAATLVVLFKHPLGGPLLPPMIALLIGGSWLIVLLLYVVLIAAMRMCILSVIASVRSPLEV
jgi:hypothetical protein